MGFHFLEFFQATIVLLLEQLGADTLLLQQKNTQGETTPAMNPNTTLLSTPSQLKEGIIY